MDVKFISILIVTVLANVVYSVIVPFLPLEFEESGIDESLYGYIFSIYALAVII